MDTTDVTRICVAAIILSLFKMVGAKTIFRLPITFISCALSQKFTLSCRPAYLYMFPGTTRTLERSRKRASQRYNIWPIKAIEIFNLENNMSKGRKSSKDIKRSGNLRYVIWGCETCIYEYHRAPMPDFLAAAHGTEVRDRIAGRSKRATKDPPTLCCDTSGN